MEPIHFVFVFHSVELEKVLLKPQGSLNKASPDSRSYFCPEEERLMFFIIMGFTLLTQMKPAIVAISSGPASLSTSHSGGREPMGLTTELEARDAGQGLCVRL